jgi:hypothetical protein
MVGQPITPTSLGVEIVRKGNDYDWKYASFNNKGVQHENLDSCHTPQEYLLICEN